MKVVAMLAGAVLLAALVWSSVAADASVLFAAAWWAPAVMLVVPAVMAGLWLRERR